LKGIREITKRDFKFYKIYLQDKSELDRVFLDNHIDYIIHLAGVKSVPESVKLPLFYYESNLIGLMNILEKVEATKSVKKIVFSSSAAVYGDVKAIKIVEDLECRPKSPYGSSKLFCEKILEDFCSMFKGSARHISGVVLRYFNPVGAHCSGLIGEHPIQPCTGLMPLLEQVLTGQKKSIQVYGSDYDTKDGSCIRDFVHIMDIAAAHIDALEYDLQNGDSETFNIGSESGYTVLEMIQMLENVCGTNIPYKVYFTVFY
jgi:UDP-glucose 4-epimerase